MLLDFQFTFEDSQYYFITILSQIFSFDLSSVGKFRT